MLRNPLLSQNIAFDSTIVLYTIILKEKKDMLHSITLNHSNIDFCTNLSQLVCRAKNLKLTYNKWVSISIIYAKVLKIGYEKTGLKQ